MSALVPVIDLTGWFSGDAAARREVAAAFDRAGREVGFLQVVGHRIDPAVRAAAFSAMDGFFALPDEVKNRCTPGDPEIYRGYSARLSESFAYSMAIEGPPDLVEAFVIGADDVGGPAGPGPFATNLWPDRPQGFRAAVWGWYLQARSLSEELCRVAALALGVDDAFFDAALRGANVTMRCNWYHRRSTETRLADEQMALGAHSDYGILTVLAADPGPGLQVLTQEGRWHDVSPATDALVINVGDALAVWTNDLWRSTIHRVQPSATPDGGVRRSIALFQDGNVDTVMECLPTCHSQERPPRYAPITLGQHVADKIRSGRTSALPTTQQTLGDRLADAAG